MIAAVVVVRVYMNDLVSRFRQRAFIRVSTNRNPKKRNTNAARIEDGRSVPRSKTSESIVSDLDHSDRRDLHCDQNFSLIPLPKCPNRTARKNPTKNSRKNRSLQNRRTRLGTSRLSMPLRFLPRTLSQKPKPMYEYPVASPHSPLTNSLPTGRQAPEVEAYIKAGCKNPCCQIRFRGLLRLGL